MTDESTQIEIALTLYEREFFIEKAKQAVTFGAQRAASMEVLRLSRRLRKLEGER